MSLRPKDHPPGGYQRDHFHGRYICRRCSSEVHDWRVHDDWHEQLDDLMTPGPAADPAVAGPGSMEELRERANTEGQAVVEATMWRGGLRQAAALVAADWAALRRLLARRAPEIEPGPLLVDSTGRAERWAAMAPLIARTTGRAE